MSEEKPRLMSVKVTAPEDEIKVLGEMIILFKSLDKAAADRALQYLRDRFVKHAK
jgi:hypothetical protein